MRTHNFPIITSRNNHGPSFKTIQQQGSSHIGFIVRTSARLAAKRQASGERQLGLSRQFIDIGQLGPKGGGGGGKGNEAHQN